MDISVILVLGMLLSSSQGDIGIPNCNFNNSIGHLQDPCCLEECNHTLEQTICGYECLNDMFLNHNMLSDKNSEYLCRHGCRQTCPDKYDGIRINDIQICVECFILCHLEIPHTSCKCQNEKIENEESSLETKDYIIIALAITSFLLLVCLVMVGCYWKRKRNKDNTKTTENIEMRYQDEDISIKDNGNIQETKHKIELVDDKPKTIAKEAQRKLDEKTRYVKDPTEPVVNTRKKRQSTKRKESVAYVNAEAIGLNRKLRDRVSNLFGKVVQRFGSTPDLSGSKEENMVELGKSIEVDATEMNTSNTSNARLTSTVFTQENPYENTHFTNNHDLGNQTYDRDPDDDDLYQNVTNVSSGKSNLSTSIPSDNGENGNQVGTDSETDSFKSARDSSGSSTMSSVETNVTQATCSANGEIQASHCHLNIKAKNVIVNMPK